MKAFKYYFLFVSIVFINACGHKIDTEVPLITSQTSNIHVDGLFDEPEWSQATVHHLSDTLDLLLFHNATDVFIGIKSLSEFQKTSTDLYLKNEKLDPINMHASMQLGERQFVQNSWDAMVNPYQWGNNELWTSNIFHIDSALREDRSVPMLKKLLYSEGQEFVISKDKLSGNSFDFALKVNAIGLDNQAKPIQFPQKAIVDDLSTWLNFQLVVQ